MQVSVDYTILSLFFFGMVSSFFIGFQFREKVIHRLNRYAIPEQTATIKKIKKTVESPPDESNAKPVRKDNPIPTNKPIKKIALSAGLKESESTNMGIISYFYKKMIQKIGKRK